MVVANHISWLDIFALNAHHPVRFVAKSEIAKWPVLSQMVRGAGTLFIERDRPRDTHRRHQEIGAAARAAATSSRSFRRARRPMAPSVLPFKSSLLQPIVEAEGHVQPVAIRYRTPDGDLAMRADYVGDTSFFESFWAVCGERCADRGRSIVRPALPARGSSSPRPCARSRSVYPNGFG